mgnify:CR=1 FL=1
MRPSICSVLLSTSRIFLTTVPNFALMVDPFNIDSIANGMNKLADNNDLRNELIDKGHQQKKVFSWSLTAELLWDCIQKAVK